MKINFYRCIAIIVSVLVSFNAFARDLTPEEQAILQSTKQEVFGGLTFQLADQVQAGQIEPLMDFEVKDSLFVN